MRRYPVLSHFAYVFEDLRKFFNAYAWYFCTSSSRIIFHASKKKKEGSNESLFFTWLTKSSRDFFIYLPSYIYFPAEKRMLAMPEEFHVKMGIILRFTAATMLRKCQEEVYENCVALWRMNSESFLMKNFPFFSQKLLSSKTILSLCCQNTHPLLIFARMSPVSENS